MGHYVVDGKTIKEWSDITGLPVRLLQKRLREGYHDVGRLFTPKIKNQVKRGSIKEFVVEHAEKQGVTTKCIYMRFYRGWTKQEIIQGYRKK